MLQDGRMSESKPPSVGGYDDRRLLMPFFGIFYTLKTWYFYFAVQKKMWILACLFRIKSGAFVIARSLSLCKNVNVAHVVCIQNLLYSEIPIIRLPMVLIESGLNNK